MERLAGITSLATYFPTEVRTNGWWVERYPELVKDAQTRALARVFSQDGEPTTHFDRAMQPYETDPFRGAKARRVAGAASAASLEVAAARTALERRGLAPNRVDLLISAGFVPERFDVGNAVFVARDLGLRGAAFNLESACGGPLNAMMTAAAFINAGVHERVLVTTSCTYLHRVPPDDTLGWFMGDGAGAMLIERGGARIVAGHARHTAETCGTWYHEIEDGRLRMRASKTTGPTMRASAEPQLRACTDGVLSKAGLALADIDFFVFHTPTAWFADFAANALGVPRDKTVCTYEDYANIGPALTTANLHRAASRGRLRSGDRVLVFGPGSAASSAAVVLEWGDVAIS
ncbi:MAG: 3-oxoacyl-[acyl-carrier-protein] synthase III C-terminal domain-containing protein [Myxococcota bacterium]